MFFSVPHIIYMLIPLLLLTALYLIFRNKSQKTKKLVVFCVAMLNALQHIFKPYIYPQFFGQSFGAISTAYNMCALLILISPVVLLVGSELWRNFLFYVGTVAGYSSILVTYWLDSAIENQIRFVICHGLLFISSFLPLLLGIFHVNYRKFWRLPFVFFGCLMILIVSNMINFTLGIAGDTGDLTMYEFIYRENPCWSMHPPENYAFIEGLVNPLTPSAFLASKGGVDTPILWFAFPMLILISVAGLLLGMILDGKRFFKDAKNLFRKIFR